jgi:hypothetical protein
VAERADGLAVREDDTEPELLDDESMALADEDVVAMAVEVSRYNSAAIIDMQYDDTVIAFLSETVVLIYPPGATVVAVADISC